MTRYLLTVLAALAGCAAQPTQCITGHSPGVCVTSTDPRIADLCIKPTVTTICLTPAYVEAAASAASAP